MTGNQLTEFKTGVICSRLSVRVTNRVTLVHYRHGLPLKGLLIIYKQKACQNTNIRAALVRRMFINTPVFNWACIL